jgi:hypothetical protein
MSERNGSGRKPNYMGNVKICNMLQVLCVIGFYDKRIEQRIVLVKKFELS